MGEGWSDAVAECVIFPILTILDSNFFSSFLSLMFATIAGWSRTVPRFRISYLGSMSPMTPLALGRTHTPRPSAHFFIFFTYDCICSVTTFDLGPPTLLPTLALAHSTKCTVRPHVLCINLHAVTPHLFRHADIGEVWANLLHNVLASLVTAHGFSSTARTDPTYVYLLFSAVDSRTLTSGFPSQSVDPKETQSSCTS